MRLRFTVDEQWFDMIKNKEKKVEGRLRKFGVENLKIGDEILFVCRENINKNMLKKVINIWNYDNCRDYLNQHLNECLPNIKSIEEGIKIYRRYFKEETEKIYGIAAIQITDI